MAFKPFEIARHQTQHTLFRKKYTKQKKSPLKYQGIALKYTLFMYKPFETARPKTTLVFSKRNAPNKIKPFDDKALR